ncbi:MAG TPA: endo-1,4-beta-xylanase [Terriglobia bacterium]|jgi:endo-1,4-beta-xylanase|nr:endo-1,4-beta-xylanase [Terriglobia bacterium]
MKMALLIIVACLLTATACLGRGQHAPRSKKTTPVTDLTLRQLADQAGIKIGSAVMPVLFRQDPDFRQVLAREYNSAESVTMFKLVHPQKERFNFAEMDQEAAFARAHGMTLFGAPLIYKPASLPDWMHSFFWTQGGLDRVTRDHIQTVVRHGGSAFSAWEVVNEPLTTTNRPWGTTFSTEEYTARAFRYAREANPNAVLVLNQSFGRSGVEPDLANRFFDLVGKVKAKGGPVDAAGIEMHLEMPSLRPGYLDEFRDFLERCHRAGLQVYVTEMDAYQGPPGAIPEAFERQKTVYHDVLATCLASPACKAFYTWGISDAHNMYQSRPRDPRRDAKPLPFDEQYQKKPAYYGIEQALEERVSKKK